MKPPFAFKARTRLAGWAMEQVRAFVALVAPWLAAPGDRPLSRAVLLIMVLLLALGLATAGIVTLEAIHAVVSRMQREEMQ